MATAQQQPRIGLSYTEAKHVFETTKPVVRGMSKGMVPAKLNRTDPGTHYFHEVTRKDGVPGIARRMYGTDVVIWWADGMVDVSTYHSMTTIQTQETLLYGEVWRRTHNGEPCLRSNGQVVAALGAYWTVDGRTGDIVSESLPWAAPGRAYPTKEIGRAMRHLRKQVRTMEALMESAERNPLYDVEMDGDSSPTERAHEFLNMVEMGVDPADHLSQLLSRFAGPPSSQLFRIDRLLRMRQLPHGELTPSAKPIDAVMHALLDRMAGLRTTMAKAA